MINFKPKGVIFDVDDTLLDNETGVHGQGLHEQSRLDAAHELGQSHGIPQLAELSIETNHLAFRNAAVHTPEGGIWNTFMMVGLRDDPVIDHDDPLLREMLTLKQQLYEVILRREGKPHTGAVAFVKALANQGLKDKLAVASTARRQDIHTFFVMTGLEAYFPDNRIISKESLTRPKPDPQAFDLAFKTLALPDADRKYVCAFEDDPRGLTSAREAGLYTCAITSRYSRNALATLETPPDIIADSYQEFAEIFGLTLG